MEVKGRPNAEIHNKWLVLFGCLAGGAPSPGPRYSAPAHARNINLRSHELRFFIIILAIVLEIRGCEADSLRNNEILDSLDSLIHTRNPIDRSTDPVYNSLPWPVQPPVSRPPHLGDRPLLNRCHPRFTHLSTYGTPSLKTSMFHSSPAYPHPSPSGMHPASAPVLTSPLRTMAPMSVAFRLLLALSFLAFPASTVPQSLPSSNATFAQRRTSSNSGAPSSRPLHWTWSHDVHRLASASYNRTINIWDPATGQCISTLKGYRIWVSSMAWLHDAHRLASASDDGTIKIWDPATGQCISTLEGHRYPVA